MSVAICWFRRDLRLSDNAALSGALDTADTVVPAVLVPDSHSPEAPGGAGQRWLVDSLDALDASLRACGSRLVSRCGDGPEALTRLAAECSATDIWCQRDWSPSGMAEETAVREALAENGVELHVTGGQYLVDPYALVTGDGRPYRVFTPYWKAWSRAMRPAVAIPAPDAIPGPAVMPASAGMLTPRRGGPDVRRWWSAGEHAAKERLVQFCDAGLADYDEQRDRPGVDGTSDLSPRLAWGELSPARVARQCVAAVGEDAAAPYLRQLAWREFAAHVLHHFPDTVRAPLRPEWAAFPWHEDDSALESWQRGRTGYPLVDAGMRQMLATGWMHNRVRLVAGSFLAKDLLIDWRIGEAFFAERLVDYDVASNVFNWQWVSGCGADAAPYFRIFNPVLQGRRFDVDGDYVREWVPELAKLPSRWIHAPWKAPDQELAKAGVVLGSTYPLPIVDHAESRERALAAYASIK